MANSRPSSPESDSGSPHRCPNCCPDMDFPAPIRWTVHLLDMPPELQSEIYLHLPNLATVVSLRLTCRQLNDVYKPIDKEVKSLLRDRLVEPFGEYYDLLQRLKLPDDSVLHPPPGGWPFFTRENLGFDKTDFAIDVLRHLPYVGGGPSYEMNIGYKSQSIGYHCSEDSSPADPTKPLPTYYLEWPEMSMEEDRLDTSLDEKKITGIRHIVVIALGHESGGITLVLDTFAGIVFEEEVRGDPRSRHSPRKYCDRRMARLEKLDEIFYPSEETWELNEWWVDESDDSDDGYEYDESYVPKPVKKHDHAAMEADGEPVPEDIGDEGDKFFWIAYLYHKFGWPGKDYKKHECMQAIDEFLGRWQEAEDNLWDEQNS
ncbi:hypothetical protein B0T11DRAFT_290566 [Plectosphaerella cucumerina]|uniref:F-box domain-containing protein n=1 Tax=Plectosphaerella cucumerina TaxID=40658 RepID=A0A8K0X0Z1_9PEZI|nr:hypothetical protein B0T11DRAFT_290566 [Plectosphaerella cucumerina]